MQLIVLGMHRSGTSAVTRLLNMMGAYVGPEESLLEANTDDVDALWEQNRKGFWERKDVVDLNEEILQSLGMAWNRVANFDSESLKAEDLDWARKRIHKVLALLEPSRPWVVKDPRLGLTLPLWREQLEVPVGVFVWRNPMEVASSLHTRNDYPIPFGLALWEMYTLQSLMAVGDMPLHIVSYGALLKDPVGVSKKLYEDVTASGVRGLEWPSENEITGFIDPALHHERATDKDAAKAVWPGIKKLISFLEANDGSKFTVKKVSRNAQEALSIYENQLNLESALHETSKREQYYQEQRENLIEERKELSSTVKNLERELRQSKQVEKMLAQEHELGRLESALAAEQRQVEQAESRAQELKLEKQRIEREADQRGAAVNELTTEKDRLERKVDQRGLAVNDLTAEKDRLEREVDQRGLAVNDLTAEKQSLELEKERLDRELTQRGEAISERERALADLKSEYERLQRESEQRGERIRDREADAKAARQDLTQFSNLMDQTQGLFEMANDHWWWKLGLRLRRVVGMLQLKGGNPQFPYDRARPFFERAKALQKKNLEQAIGAARRTSSSESQRATSSTSSPSSDRKPINRTPDVQAPRIAPRSVRPIHALDANIDSDRAATFSRLKWSPTVDVIVTIHNALDDVRLCLESLVRDTEQAFGIIAVNDGSEPEMKTYLDAFARVHSRCAVIHNEDAKGYTVAANQGLKESTADFVILLNSDTILPCSWLDDLLDCAQSNANIGIVGPLSNAASFQSVPDRKTPEGDWAVNALPEGFTVDDMATLVRNISERRFPRVPFVNGFCYMIKRSVIETIGYLDEDTFPHGYGEENDYSIRARDAGFTLAIADQAYVFHAKSKSFGHSRRQELSRTGYDALKAKQGAERLGEGVREMEAEPTLADMAARVKHCLEEGEFEAILKGSPGTAKVRVESDEIGMARSSRQGIGEFSQEEYARFTADIESKDESRSTGEVSAAVIVLALDAWESERVQRSIDSCGSLLDRSGVHVLATQVNGLPDEVRNRAAVQIHEVERENVSEGLNDILDTLKAEYVLVLRGGDTLGERALAHLDTIAEKPLAFRESIGAIVIDDDVIQEDGARSEPRFKPGWSPNLLLEHDYIGNGVWLNCGAVRSAGGFSPAYTYEFLPDLLLRIDEAGFIADKMDYVDLHCAHRQDAVVSRMEQRQIIADRAARQHLEVDEIEMLAGGPRPRYNAGSALVSIIIPFRDRVDLLEQCVESILGATNYTHYEVLLVDNQSEESATLAYLDSLAAEPRIRVLRYDKPFNYSRINNFAAERTRGEVLLFLNNDTQVISSNWLDELVSDAVQPGVGSVGALLYFGDGSIQHAGVVVGLNGLAGHIFSGLTDVEVPPMYLRCRREVSAVTGACLAIRKGVFEEVGRFNEEFLITGNDVELGLRIRDHGYRNIFNPQARLFHYEKSSRAHIRVKDVDIDLSLLYYQPYLDEGDPYFNRNYSLNTTKLELTQGKAPAHIAFREKYLAERDKREQKHPISLARPEKGGGQKLPDEEVVVYDVSPEILRENSALMQRFYRDPYLDLDRVLWFVPHFDHVYRGGIFTIFRTANYLSERAGTHNTIVLYGHRRISLDQIELELRQAFPNLNFELMEYSPNRDVNELPESDAAFCTLWTSAYYLVRYNKCKAKFSFLQDYEPCFYAAGTVFGLIEQTYRFGFVGIANTPGVADVYRAFNPWIEHFIPAVDQSIYHPSANGQTSERPYRIVFYGRPANSRNAFRLGIEALKKVKEVYGDKVEIVSAGADFAPKDYGVEGVIENLGILGSLEEVASVYRDSDIGLVFMFSAHPSYQPFEFMASGCVTITNDNPRNRWLLKDGENAMLVEPTVSCVASKIVEVLEQPETRSRVIEGGLATVGALNWENALEKIYQFVRHPRISKSGVGENGLE